MFGMNLNRNTNTIFWSYDVNRNKALTGFELLGFPPEPVLNVYYNDVKSLFMKCPAFKSEWQNTYVIRSPIDMEIEYHRGHLGNKRMNVIRPSDCSPEVKKYLLKPRFNNAEGKNAHEVFSLMTIPYIFWSESSVMMNYMHPFLEWDNPNGLRVLGGHFDIGKWRRHLEYAAELRHPEGIFKFKRGDIMMYVRFTLSSQPHKKVVLKETKPTQQLLDEIQHNSYLKYFMPKCPLEMLYNLRSTFNKRKG